MNIIRDDGTTVQKAYEMINRMSVRLEERDKIESSIDKIGNLNWPGYTTDHVPCICCTIRSGHLTQVSLSLISMARFIHSKDKAAIRSLIQGSPLQSSSGKGYCGTQ